MHEQKFKRCKTSILGNYSPNIGLLLISLLHAYVLSIKDFERNFEAIS